MGKQENETNDFSDSEGNSEEETGPSSSDMTSSMTPHQQLHQLHHQLQQVNDFIASDPENAQYLQTREDLLTVITMTENLIDVQNNQENGESLTIQQQHRQQQDYTSSQLLENVNVGDRIEVISGERPYPAVLLSVNPTTSQCTLKYYEFGTEVVLSLHEIRKIPLKAEFLPDQIAPGLRCQCKYPPDQKWYEAKIEAVTADGYTVIFTQYGTTMELPLEYLRHIRLSTSKLQKRLSERHMIETNVVIPDNLKINPTDTEAQKERKKRKIKAIKSKARIEVKEQEQSATQDNWRAFQAKAEKKKSLLSAPSTKKHSLFTSPDAVDGKVGVTGSGQGMTDYEQRKKYKFNLLNT